MIPMLRDVKSNNRIQKLYFSGINLNDIIGDQEIKAGKNLNTDNLPAISPRKSKETIVSGITRPNGFFFYDGKLGYQDGTDLYYDSSLIGSIEDSKKSFEIFNKEIIIVPDKKSFDGTTLTNLQGSIYIERGDLDENGLVKLDKGKIRSRGYIMVVPGETITFSNSNSYTHDVYEFDKDFKFITVTKGLASQKTLGSDTEHVKIVMNGADVTTELTVNTAKGYPSEGKLPNITKIKEHYNRIFGIKENSIYASAWGDKDNWAYFQGLENDSWAIDTKSEGDFIAINNFQNHVVFFKENEMKELYGYNPSEFQLQDIAEVGCINQNAVCEHKNVLYFISQNDIYMYSGGMPRPIGQKLNIANIDDGAIGGFDNKIYASFTRNGTDWETYVFDLSRKAWLPINNKQILQFVNYKNNFYELTANGDIIKYNSGTEKVSWEFETKKFNDQSFNNKITTKIRLRAKMETDSSIKIYTSDDEENYILEDTFTNFTNKEHKTISTILQPNRHQVFQIKIVGTGDVVIHGHREVYEVSDKNE